MAACADTPPDNTPDCDPATVLRLIPTVSTGAVTVTTAAEVTSGTIDARAGGVANAVDNPYIYVDLRTGTKVEVNDLDALTSTTWDIALKRSSIRANGGDSGAGNRQIAIVAATTLAEVTAGPSAGYTVDDFTTDDCAIDTLEAGEPRTTFGEWYGYTEDTHQLTPKSEIYVVERNNGSRTAFRIVNYYGGMPSASALYAVEWKQLPSK
jgi:hypothetical protein